MTQNENPNPSTPTRRRTTHTTFSVPLDIGESITSVERRDGRIITTIVKVELDNGLVSPPPALPPANPSPVPSTGAAANTNRQSPVRTGTSRFATVAARNSGDGYPSDDDTSDGAVSDAESLVVVDGNQPPAPNPTRTAPSGVPMVPVPTELRRPATDSPTTKYYVVFAGLRVGIWSGIWDRSVGPYVLRVPNSRNRGFESWDSALWHYAAAYQGVYPFRKGWYKKQQPGWNPHIEGTTAVANPNASAYTYGNGPKIGEVDVAGLDLDAELLPWYVEDVPPPDENGL
ncbi:hypothetical protein V5O48_009658 [Marasmius crinis-equi]|uniref:Uncharacterized protein n=1 Tax=Marasmius crinis-equi TaxID=585013 RepID=A0ABR3FAJ1_9AGAR